MEKIIFQEILNGLKENKKMALCMITNTYGSSPGKQGFLMLVYEDGKSIGTVGGGVLEKEVIKDAVCAIKNGENKMSTYSLTESGLKSHCGGKVDVFIKILGNFEKLLIVGGGHIALELYKFAKLLGFYVVIFEDREEYGNKERFPHADEIIIGDIAESLRNYNINQNSYVVIVTRGHEKDEEALKEVIKKDAKYIGMIGSKNKVNHIFNKLKQEGYEDYLKKVYAPIGIKLGGNTPSEIALSIISEIVLIKNGGKLEHCKEKPVL